jgi:hypothetical protein
MGVDMDILLKFVVPLLMFILGITVNHFYRKWRIESPKIKIFFEGASWFWDIEQDYSAGGEDWNVLKLEISFVVRNFGAPVSIVADEIEIFSGKQRKNDGDKLVDPSHQVNLNYEWPLLDDYSGLDKKVLNSLPSKITSGKLMISDSLGNSYFCAFQVPAVPIEKYKIL